MEITQASSNHVSISVYKIERAPLDLHLTLMGDFVGNSTNRLLNAEAQPLKQESEPLNPREELL